MKTQDEIQKVIETINRKVEQINGESKQIIDGDFCLAALEPLSAERDKLNDQLKLLNWVIS